MARARQQPMKRVSRKKVGEERKTKIFNTKYIDKEGGEYRQFRDKNIWVSRLGSVIYYDKSVPKPYTQWYRESKVNGVSKGVDICIMTGSHERWSVKRLVWECYMGKIPKDCAIMRIENVKTLNELCNLRMIKKSELGKVCGGMNNKTRFVIEKTTGRKFRGCQEAANYYGICKTTVARICNGKMKSSKGLKFVWGELVCGTF